MNLFNDELQNHDLTQELMQPKFNKSVKRKREQYKTNDTRDNIDSIKFESPGRGAELSSDC